MTFHNILDISSASPKARKFARELGVDINQVAGSQKDGRVVEDDIKKVNQQIADLDNQKGEATKLLYALDGARQLCVSFLQELNNDGQASGQSDVSQEEEATSVALS